MGHFICFARLSLCLFFCSLVANWCKSFVLKTCLVSHRIMVAICNHSFRICQTFFRPGFFWCNWSQMHSGFAFDWEIPPMGHFTCQIITNKTIIDVCFCSNKHARHLLFDVFFERGHLMRQKNLLSCSEEGLVAMISQNFIVASVLEWDRVFCLKKSKNILLHAKTIKSMNFNFVKAKKLNQ